MKKLQNKNNVETEVEMVLRRAREQLERARVAPGDELGQGVLDLQQKIQDLQDRQNREAVRARMAIGNHALEVGVVALKLTGAQLRGALLSIVEGAKDPAVLAQFEAAGQAWYDSRRPPGDRVSVFVSADVLGAELADECAAQGLRRVPAAKAFSGKLALESALEIGRRYGASVSAEYRGEDFSLVERGEVDAEVVGGLVSKLRDRNSPVSTAVEPLASIGADQGDVAASEEAAPVAAAADFAPPSEATAAVDPSDLQLEADNLGAADDVQELEGGKQSARVSTNLNHADDALPKAQPTSGATSEGRKPSSGQRFGLSPTRRLP